MLVLSHVSRSASCDLHYIWVELGVGGVGGSVVIMYRPELAIVPSRVDEGLRLLERNQIILDAARICILPIAGDADRFGVIGGRVGGS